MSEGTILGEIYPHMKECGFLKIIITGILSQVKFINYFHTITTLRSLIVGYPDKIPTAILDVT